MALCDECNSMTTQFAFADIPHAKLGSLKLHYAYADKAKKGQTKKPLLLCMHGFPEFWYTWHQQLKSLSDDFFVVAPDMRGFNLSDKPQGLEFYTLQELVMDALALVNHLGYETFTLVGHDWGGLMAWTLATLHPEVLDKLIIINSPHPRIHQQLLTHSKRQIASSQYVSKFLDNSAAEKLSRNNFDLMWRFAFNELVEKGVFGDKEKIIYKTAWAQEGALEATLSLYRAANFVIPAKNDKLAVSQNQSLPVANKITCETLVIWGMADTALSSECLDDLDAYVENLEIVKIPGAGHCVIHECPELISETVRNFCL